MILPLIPGRSARRRRELPWESGYFYIENDRGMVHLFTITPRALSLSLKEGEPLYFKADCGNIEISLEEAMRNRRLPGDDVNLCNRCHVRLSNLQAYAEWDETYCRVASLISEQILLRVKSGGEKSTHEELRQLARQYLPVPITRDHAIAEDAVSLTAALAFDALREASQE